MNYEGIANLVHECVKNPKSVLTQADKYDKNVIRPTELSAIQNVFFRCEVSGGTATIETDPLIAW